MKKRKECQGKINMEIKSIPRRKNISLYIGEILYPCGILCYVDQEFSFSYSPTWLAHPDAFPLFTGFPLTTDTFTSPVLPLPFEDATADSFGRKVMQEGASLAGEFINGIPLIFDTFDFFANTHPVSRQGGFVFQGDAAKTKQVKMFEKELTKTAFQNFVYSFEQKNYSISDFFTFLKYMHSSGGMRPKYAFLQDDELWLAKTNNREDFFPDGILWEAVNLSMARECEISVPPFSYDNGWLSVQRFDREEGRPVSYISAKTMLNLSEHKTVSYADIAKHCSVTDSQELFRRCCFNVAVANCDEHLKNHGFLYTGKAWKLSPVFDIMSFPLLEVEQEHSLIIGNNSFLGTKKNLLADVVHFNLTKDDAQYIIDKIFKTVENSFFSIAQELGATETQIRRMIPIYTHEEKFNFFEQGKENNISIQKMKSKRPR